MLAIRFKNCHAAGKNFPSSVAFCISACVHLAFGLALALILIRSNQDKTVSIMASEVASNEVHEIEFIAVPETQALVSPAEAVFEAAVELPAIATIEPSIPAALNFRGDFHNSITSYFNGRKRRIGTICTGADALLIDTCRFEMSARASHPAIQFPTTRL